MAQGEKKEFDRRDGLKLAQLSARQELELVHVPQSDMRQWRALIAYRQHLVQRRHAQMTDTAANNALDLTRRQQAFH